MNKTKSSLHFKNVKLYIFNAHKGNIMPQVISHENQRIAFRISSEDKAILTKAAELSHTNMTEFMLQLVLLI